MAWISDVMANLQPLSAPASPKGDTVQFPSLGLLERFPLEIREIIYEFVLDLNCASWEYLPEETLATIAKKNQAKKAQPQGLLAIAKSWLWPRKNSPGDGAQDYSNKVSRTSVLRVSKQIYTEAYPILFKTNEFCFRIHTEQWAYRKDGSLSYFHKFGCRREHYTFEGQLPTPTEVDRFPRSLTFNPQMLRLIQKFVIEIQYSPRVCPPSRLEFCLYYSAMHDYRSQWSDYTQPKGLDILANFAAILDFLAKCTTISSLKIQVMMIDSQGIEETVDGLIGGGDTGDGGLLSLEGVQRIRKTNIQFKNAPWLAKTKKIDLSLAPAYHEYINDRMMGRNCGRFAGEKYSWTPTIADEDNGKDQEEEDEGDSDTDDGDDQDEGHGMATGMANMIRSVVKVLRRDG